MQASLLKKKKLPDNPGVYLFKKNKDILYIGRATSLKDRIKSYFANDLIQTRGPLLVEMIFKANKIDFIKTDSILEAIILEANLIKKYQPKYNTKEKDNKSFNYVVITAEDFPRVLIVRGREIEKGLPYKIKNKFGPFSSSESIKIILKIIRKIFPYRDRCVPLSGQPCFNKQLGLCPGACEGTINKKDYLKIIKKITLILSGKIRKLKKDLSKDMKFFAKTGEYEKANEVKKQIFALEHIQDVTLISAFSNHPGYKNNHPSLAKAGKGEGNSAFSSLVKEEWRGLASRGGCFRIEAYDLAHLSGTNNVGVMVVMENRSGASWELKKSDYRKFKIRNTKGNDIGALKEILERRFKHKEWPSPDLIVVDGGMGQVNVARNIIELNRPRHQNATPSSSDEGVRSKLKVTIVAVTKDNHHKPKAIIGDENIINKYKKEILLINNEAHRFAITFHRQKRNVIL